MPEGGAPAERAAALESLLDSLRAVAAATDPETTLAALRREAERLFGPGTSVADDGGGLRIERAEPFDRVDAARAALLAEGAARALENVRLMAEARVRDAERTALTERLITAEQDERRRLALVLHDTSVQSLSGIALMLDATMHSIETGRLDEATGVLGRALERQRATIGALRDLSFALEPVVLRDQGLGPAVHALAEEIGLAHGVRFDVDVEAAEALGETVKAGLYQIVRESLEGAVRRGPPTRVWVIMRRLDDGSVETTVTDDAPGERRRSTIETLEERVRTLSGGLELERGASGGMRVRVTIPPYATG